MGDVIIRSDGLGKKYLIGHSATQERYVALRDIVARSATSFARAAGQMFRGRPIVSGDRIEEFWALRDVSFEIERGDVVGIIGRNGAGKSTLLKILSRITEPSEGRVEIKGRVASLLEVGTGFHPELSGRENIYLNGAILGMTHAEIARKFDEIVAFAEIERFLDTPVKRYSSGMYVRLAFAVAAHLEPEILIVDEVLAVGDTEFQNKCLGKMQDVASGGRTVLFVSHNLTSVRQLCKTGLVLKNGNIIERAGIGDCIDLYLATQARDGSVSEKTISEGNAVRVEPQTILADREGRHKGKLIFSVTRPISIYELTLLIYTTSGVRVAIADLRSLLSVPIKLPAGETAIEFSLNLPDFSQDILTLGLFFVADLARGEHLNLADLAANTNIRNPNLFNAYPSQYRGVIAIDASAELATIELTHEKAAQS